MMEKTLLAFIWRHSRRDQFIVVCVTLLLFPLLYLTLELPKRIINDAIGAQSEVVTYLGIDISQTSLLLLLCFVFLGAVIAHGLLKMRVNTMKGVLAERLLRRFRYTLIGRILRFPRSYQAGVSEGELAAMVTAEAEPLGGIMGDAFANPLLQAGQMITILLFLFIQNLWFGLTAIALIPVQAWLIPRMQAKINLLNRSRILQVRDLASEIGELSEGATVLRQHGGWRYRKAAMSARLGKLFDTRFEIYRRKYFMKFVNNFLTQLTPFFYFLVGGLLVINGELTIGALVAAIAAFKDLSDPWKELLTYYTAVQEVSQRYIMIVGRFTPADLLEELPDTSELTQTAPTAPKLSFENVVLEDVDGHQVLSGADLTLESGSWTCVTATDDGDCTALALLLLRELSANSGRVLWNDQPLADIAPESIVARTAHIVSSPHIFEGTLGENVMLPLRQQPGDTLTDAILKEARRSGNSTESVAQLWHPAQDASNTLDRAGTDWSRLIELTGGQRLLLARILDHPLDATHDASFFEALVAARGDITAQLDRSALLDVIQVFGSGVYVDELTLPENLLNSIAAQDQWLDPHATAVLVDVLTELDLRDKVLAQGKLIAETLLEVFDSTGTKSALFQRLGLPDGILKDLELAQQRIEQDVRSRARQKNADTGLFLSLSLNIPAAQLDRVFSDDLKAAVVAARKKAAELSPDLKADFVPLDSDAWHPRLNAFENLIFGKVEPTSRNRREKIRTLVVDVLDRQVDPANLMNLIQNLPTTRRGKNLPKQLLEQISIAQAVVKKPSLVILDRVLASQDAAGRNRAMAALRDLLPDATILQLETETPKEGMQDRDIELRQGHFTTLGQDGEETVQTTETTDLQRKVLALRRAPLFRELSRQQLRLLAFSARWVTFDADAYVFRKNDLPDGAFLIYEGDVSLIERTDTGEEAFVINPPLGTLVGELGLIRNDPRRLDMRADSDVTLLRIEADDFLSILETDARTGFKLIQSLIGYLDRPAQR
ncbi:MAG: cyclic nucleotide-binding domain-containing protein [Sulfitobacter sp.]